MRQVDYDVIVACLKYGSPAIYERLMTALNQTIENANKFEQFQREAEARRALEEEQRKKAEEEKKMARARAKAKAKAKIEGHQGDSDE